MNAVTVFGVLSLVIGGCAICLDRYSDRTIPTGSTIMRTKTMGDTTLVGTYRCTCHNGGALHCSAVDIPCWDVTKKTFVPKYSKFHALVRNQVMRCECMGERARFANCIPLTVVQRPNVEENTIACEDLFRNKFVTTGDWYVTKRFGQTLNCTCDSGRPQRGSCRLAQGVSIDPCKNHDCHYSATCSPQGNSYTCQCKPGYTGNGRTCNDVDECRSGSAECDSNANCLNTIGSYTCTCKRGFSGDGFFCTDRVTVDPCNEGSWYCHTQAECIPDGSDYSCACVNGYTGNGFECSDIDECAAGSSYCNDHAHCNNTVGSYKCTCMNGYEGDGYYCTEMCRDEAVGNYVKTGQVYTKISGGIQKTCTCNNGQAVENSCISSREEVIPVEATCSDALTGGEVNSGEYYVALFRQTKLRCLCHDGRPHRGSCRVHRQTAQPTARSSTTTRTTTPTTTASTTRRTSRYRECRDGSTGRSFKPGDTYIWRRGSAAFICTCTKYQGTSKCKRKYD